MSVLRAEGLTAAYGATEVLHDLSIEIESGCCTAIIGPNGCGKSTLLRCLSNLHRLSKGSVWLDARDLSLWRPRELARFMAVVPQSSPDVAGLTVREFVALGRHPHIEWMAQPGAKDRDAVSEALALCGLEPRAARKIETLSGGERQRARIALALAQQPSVMLLDEPISFLDIRHQLEILELIARLSDSRGLTAVMVLHDINLSIRYCRDIVALKEGSILASGLAEKVATPEVLARLFDVLAAVSVDPIFGRKLFSFYRTPGEKT